MTLGMLMPSAIDFQNTEANSRARHSVVGRTHQLNAWAQSAHRAIGVKAARSNQSVGVRVAGRRQIGRAHV